MHAPKLNLRFSRHELAAGGLATWSPAKVNHWLTESLKRSLKKRQTVAAAARGISSVTTILVRRTGAFGDVIDTTPVVRRDWGFNGHRVLDLRDRFDMQMQASVIGASRAFVCSESGPMMLAQVTDARSLPCIPWRCRG